METRGLVIAGLSGGSGKSVVSVGITATLAKESTKVVPFKKGPDYIDAGWLQVAAGNSCYNLDPYLMTRELIGVSVRNHSRNCDFIVVEGNRGLYDGVNVEGGYSTAELAVTLDLPVLLVVNCTKMTRTVAAMVLGCQQFDKRVDIRGVILNEIATQRQRELISEAVEKYTGVPVLGAVPRLKEDIFPMRHLGMVPYQEYRDSNRAVDFLAELIKNHVDLARVKEIMAPVASCYGQNVQIEPENAGHVQVEKPGVKIGVLQDEAFQFYYSENLEALENSGASLIYINAMNDKALPALDGLYIGGGFPETGARQLAANESFRNSVKKEAEGGLPIYAECGGLIYLGQSIEIDKQEFALVGLFPIRFGMSQKPQAHGYSIFQVDRKNPYYVQGAEVKGHEFRYSTILDSRVKDSQLAVKMIRGKGFTAGRDGLVFKNVFALYTHIHADGTPEWAENFVACCSKFKSSRV